MPVAQFNPFEKLGTPIMRAGTEAEADALVVAVFAVAVARMQLRIARHTQALMAGLLAPRSFEVVRVNGSSKDS